MNLTWELTTECERRRPITKCSIDDACDAKRRLVFKWTPHDLHSDWKAFRRAAYRHHGGRGGKHIEPLRVPDRVEVLDPLAFDAPRALPMLECWNARHRAEKHRKLAHGFERLLSHRIDVRPRVQQL